VFTLDEQTGEVLFGDGVRGALPRGEAVIAAMARTRGEGGNIAPGRITELDGLPVTQPEQARGGAARESVAEALARTVASRRQAVTAADIEQIVLETPGIRVERAKAFAGPEQVEAGSPRIVLIAVKTASGAPTAEDARRIRAHLEPFRLVCREFTIVAPERVRVDISLELRALPHGPGFVPDLECAVREYFAANCAGFGAAIRPARVQAAAGERAGVLEVRRCAISAYGNARRLADGSVILPPGALAELRNVGIYVSGAE
jgi:uncharacterized phage protein gp47/JayE